MTNLTSSELLRTWIEKPTLFCADSLPFIKCFLIKTYCLSLYGCSLWSLSSPSIRIIEVAFNKLLRKIWNLPYNSHTGIVHCTAKIHSVSNMLYDRFCSLHSFALSSSSSPIQSIFVSSTQHIYSYMATHITYIIILKNSMLLL